MTRQSTASTFERATFSAPQERCRRFTGWILSQVGDGNALRILDVGCGTGEQLFHLAAALPAARLTGVDISARNIELATRRAERLGLSPRVSFAACDYMQFSSSPQDLIISYSTLQLIREDSRRLFAKVSGDLVTGGLLMNVMPYECAFNSALMGVRRVLAALRSGFTDALIFRAAKLLHGRALDDDLIRERVAYMYETLERFDGPALRELMDEECGLEFIAEAPELHASLAQAKHRLSVFRKRGAGS